MMTLVMPTVHINHADGTYVLNGDEIPTTSLDPLGRMCCHISAVSEVTKAGRVLTCGVDFAARQGKWNPVFQAIFPAILMELW